MTGVPSGLKAINWSQYASWPSFIGSDGHTYYIPPGGEGYAYDPFLNHLFQDGRQAKAAAQKAVDDQNQAVKDANSPVRQFGTLAGVAGITAGIPILANKLYPSPNPVEDATAALIRSQIPQKTVQQVTPTVVPNAAAAAQAATQTAAQGGGVQAAGAVADPSIAPLMQNGSLDLITPESQAAYGGNALPATVPEDPGMFSSSSLTAAPGTLGSIISVAAAAKGAYDALNGFQHGGKGIRPGLTELGAGVGGFGGPLGSLIGAGMGNLAGYGLQGNGFLNHAALIANPLTWPLEAAKLAGFNLIHETTRQHQQKNTQDLLSQSDDPTWQGYVSAIRAQNDSAPPDPSKPFFGGKYGTFDEYKNSAQGLQASDLTGVVGNLQTYGPDWAKLTEAQRQAVTEKNIQSGLYTPHKGEVIITDPATAKQNYDSVVGGGVNIPTTNAQAAAQGAIVLNPNPPTVVKNPTPIPRS